MKLERDVSNTRGLYTDLVSGFYFPSSGTWNVAVQFEMLYVLEELRTSGMTITIPRSTLLTGIQITIITWKIDQAVEQTWPFFLPRDVLNQHKAADGRDGNSSQQRP